MPPVQLQVRKFDSKDRSASFLRPSSMCVFARVRRTTTWHCTG